jgi:hypothetical protein
MNACELAALDLPRNHIRAILRAMGADSRLEGVLIGPRAGVIIANSSSTDDNRSQPQ